MLVARRLGNPNAHTLLTFQTFLPRPVGRPRESIRAWSTASPTSRSLTGERQLVGFTAELIVGPRRAYANTLGAYKIAADGTI
jgi:hypothetical protein